MKKKTYITRKEAIEACVKSYIKNNPIEWMDFQKQVARKRASLIDPKFGVSVDDYKGWKEGSNLDVVRKTITLPATLANAISVILLNHDNQPAFPENNKEEAWFVRTFPDFLVPEKY